jgi:hypothetical protein
MISITIGVVVAGIGIGIDIECVYKVTESMHYFPLIIRPFLTYRPHIHHSILHRTPLRLEGNSLTLKLLFLFLFLTCIIIIIMIIIIVIIIVIVIVINDKGVVEERDQPRLTHRSRQ